MGVVGSSVLPTLRVLLNSQFNRVAKISCDELIVKTYVSNFDVMYIYRLYGS